MKERLQKILSARGVASRRKAEEMIAQGQVTVNGTLAGLGDTADPETDVILVSGQPLPKQEPPASKAFSNSAMPLKNIIGATQAEHSAEPIAILCR